MEATAEITQAAVPAEDDYQAYKSSRATPPEPVEEPAKESVATEAEEAPKAETKVEQSESSKEKKGGWQRRIDKLTKENDELRARLTNPEKPLAQDAVPAKQETKAEGKPEKPKSTDFDSYEAYTDAHEAYLERLQDWKLEQWRNQQQEQERRAQAQQQQQAQQRTWNERLEAAKARIPDFDDVVQGAIADHDIQISEAMSQAITTSEHGPEVVYFLAKNPAEAARIASLAPLAAAREIGKLELKITPDAEPAKPAKAVSAAPPPVKPVGSTASTVKTLDDVGDDYQAYKALRLKKAR